MTDEKIMNEIANELEADATQALDALGAEKTAVMPAVEDGAGGADTEDDAGGDGAHGPAVGADDAGATAPAEKKRPRKGVIAAVAAVAAVAAIACGVAFAMPATSGAASSASSAAAATASKSSASASASPAAATSSAAASSAATSSVAASNAGADASKNASGDVEQKQDATGQGTAQGNAGTGGTPAEAPTASKPAHEHNWVPITETRTVVDQEAWDEPVYENVDHFGCSICGDVGPVDGSAHLESHGDERASGGWFTVKEQVGTTHHDAVTHEETVTVGYQCSGCGATK